MTVDLSKLKAGDIIKLREGSEHLVTASEIAGDGSYYRVKTEFERYCNGHFNPSWCHRKDGSTSGSEAQGDIVEVKPRNRSEIVKPRILDILKEYQEKHKEWQSDIPYRVVKMLGRGYPCVYGDDVCFSVDGDPMEIAKVREALDWLVFQWGGILQWDEGK